MTAPDIRARLFVGDDLLADVDISPTREQQHYLMNVMRLRDGDAVALFNGRDGEWRAVFGREGRRECQLAVKNRTRAQASETDLWLLFAPVKKARLDVEEEDTRPFSPTTYMASSNPNVRSALSCLPLKRLRASWSL